MEKEQSRLSRAPDLEVAQSQDKQNPHLGETEKNQSRQEHGEERVDSTVKEVRFQKSEGGQARKASLE